MAAVSRKRRFDAAPAPPLSIDGHPVVRSFLIQFPINSVAWILVLAGALPVFVKSGLRPSALDFPLWFDSLVKPAAGLVPLGLRRSAGAPDSLLAPLLPSVCPEQLVTKVHPSSGLQILDTARSGLCSLQEALDTPGWVPSPAQGKELLRIFMVRGLLGINDTSQRNIVLGTLSGHPISVDEMGLKTTVPDPPCLDPWAILHRNPKQASKHMRELLDPFITFALLSEVVSALYSVEECKRYWPLIKARAGLLSSWINRIR